MKHLTIDEILKAVDGEIICGFDYKDTIIKNVSTDSRNINENDLFVPIKGNNFDGHDFLEQCFLKNSVVSLSEIDFKTEKGVVIKVLDTKKALGDLAKFYINLFDIKVIGITGSAGKTTSKDIIASVCETNFKVLKTKGNLNNDIGLPLTIFDIEEHHEIAVLEMGMNNFNEIDYLSNICTPDIGIITNIGVSHIENLGSREGILNAKCEMIAHLNKNGVVILNADDDMLVKLDDLDLIQIFYGVTTIKQVFASDIEILGVDGINCNIHTPKGSFSLEISIPGLHMVYNALCATCVGLCLNLQLLDIKKGIENFKPTKSRMEITTSDKGKTIINDVYNANPVSMKGSIEVLASTKGKNIAILGDMFELGRFAYDMHYDIGCYVVKNDIDTVVCIGEHCEAMFKGALDVGHKNVFHYKTKEDYFANGMANILDYDVILIKASRGMHFEEIVDKIKEVI